MKGVKTGLLQEDQLAFELSPNPPEYVPSCLAVPEVTSQALIKLPVIIQSKERTFELSGDHDQAKATKEFWTMLRERLRLMKPVLAQHQFAVVEPEEMELLKVGGALLPGLLGSNENLLYENNIKTERITKANFKSYLTTIGLHLKTLIDTEKDIKQNASQTQPLTRTKVALALQNGSKEEEERRGAVGKRRTPLVIPAEKTASVSSWAAIRMLNQLTHSRGNETLQNWHQPSVDKHATMFPTWRMSNTP